MQWDAPAKTRPYLTNVRAEKMRVVAAKSHGVPTIKNNLYVYLKDKNGNPIKAYRKPLDGNVVELDFSFDGVDMSRVHRLSFALSGSGQHMHIRRIILGDAAPPVASGTCPGVKPLNDRFEKLLNKWMKKGSLSADEMPAFMKLLQCYRGLE